MRRSADKLAKACASVLATTNSTPFRPRSIMLLTALPPAPPTPKTVMRGLSSVRSGTLRLMVMALFRSFNRLYSARFRRFPAMRPSRPLKSKIVPYPVADLGEIAGAGAQEALLAPTGQPVVAATPMQQQADRRGEIGPTPHRW